MFPKITLLSPALAAFFQCCYQLENHWTWNTSVTHLIRSVSYLMIEFKLFFDIKKLGSLIFVSALVLLVNSEPCLSGDITRSFFFFFPATKQHQSVFAICRNTGFPYIFLTGTFCLNSLAYCSSPSKKNQWQDIYWAKKVFNFLERRMCPEKHQLWALLCSSYYLTKAVTKWMRWPPLLQIGHLDLQPPCSPSCLFTQ